MSILVTGANGFVGSKLVETLAERGHEVIACMRQASIGHSCFTGNVHLRTVDALSSETDWTTALDSADVVIHSAAKVHDMQVGNNYESFRRANVDGTISLARQAEQASVKRFIFLSTLKVHGETSPAGRPFVADDLANPSDAYSKSKHEAECALRELSRNSSMELVIVRPPLVYGPGVKANFLSLMKAVDRSMPLPLAGITGNRRSLVSLYNLVDFLICTAQHPNAANETFLISDDEDLSTARLLEKIAEALDKLLYAVPVPPSVLLTIAKMFGKQHAMQRLTSDLAADISKAKQRLAWNPVASSTWAMAQTAAQYRNGR
jgi:nucleoside-diphosphate-sugar epimerase